VTDDQRGPDGSRRELLLILDELLVHLGYDSPEVRVVAWIQEREEAVARLREICAVYGDNDWLPHTHLGEVIEKHLQRHLDNPPMPT
jgi:hypothetical protein